MGESRLRNAIDKCAGQQVLHASQKHTRACARDIHYIRVLYSRYHADGTINSTQSINCVTSGFLSQQEPINQEMPIMTVFNRSNGCPRPAAAQIMNRDSLMCSVTVIAQQARH